MVRSLQQNYGQLSTLDGRTVIAKVGAGAEVCTTKIRNAAAMGWYGHGTWRCYLAHSKTMVTLAAVT